MSDSERLLSQMREFGQLVQLASKLKDMSPKQKRILAVVGGLGGATAIVAALRNERFQQFLKEAGEDTMKFTEETGKDVWAVLKEHIPALGERATERFGENVVTPFFGKIADEIVQNNPLPELIDQGITRLRRFGVTLGDTIGERLFRDPSGHQP